jgi:DNA-binding response OmpR family regulator
MNILVIDDDALVLKSLSQRLTDEGHSVDTARDGGLANDKIENAKTPPDLIICDLLMPNFSGLTFMSMLRNFHNYSIPVIVISSLQQGELLAAQAGFPNIDFLAKPFAFEEITKRVEKYNLNLPQA